MRYVPRPVGRFGAFGYAYRIDRDRVTLQRNPWLAIPAVLLIAGGAALATVMGGKSFALEMPGMIGVLAGLLIGLAAVAPPRRVTATAKGLRWGRASIPAGEIRSIESVTKEIYVKGQRVQYAALVVHGNGIADRELRLENGGTRNLRVVAIADAMAALLGLAPPRASAADET
jgi:DNA-binding transcriptional regulator YdaS (Cro superfamily)